MTSTRSNQYVLAIDLGSGGPKVALVTQQGQFVAKARRVTHAF